jgi:hypothetical protein
MIGLLLLLQTAAPTVGDTIWVSRTVAVPVGSTVRASDWDPADPVELLGPPRVVAHGDSTDVAYAIVVWRPGVLTVDPPGPLVLGADGRVDSLPRQPLTLTIASVLPKAPIDSPIAPQPRADFVSRWAASPLPLLLLWGLAILLLAPLHLWWWRRGPEPGAARGEAGLTPPAPLERWGDAGESRAVAAVGAARLRAAIATAVPAAHAGLDTPSLMVQLHKARPDWPLSELSELLQALDEARFGNADPVGSVALARRAEQLAPRLLAPAA